MRSPGSGPVAPGVTSVFQGEGTVTVRGGRELGVRPQRDVPHKRAGETEARGDTLRLHPATQR